MAVRNLLLLLFLAVSLQKTNDIIIQTLKAGIVHGQDYTEQFPWMGEINIPRPDDPFNRMFVASKKMTT